MDMDFSGGHESILQALILSKEKSDLSAKISTLINSLDDDKSHAITALCSVLALQSEEIEKKEKLSELLEKVLKYWTMLLDDREKLLLTISNLEMEKAALKQSMDDPRGIYQEILDMEASTQKNPRSKISDIHHISSIASCSGSIVKKDK